MGGHITRHVTGDSPLQLGNHSNRRTDLAGRAISALEAVIFNEGVLERMQVILTGESLNCGDLATVVLRSQSQAGEDAFAVDQKGAGAARPLIAAFFRTVQVKVLPEQVEQ